MPRMTSVHVSTGADGPARHALTPSDSTARQEIEALRKRVRVAGAADPAGVGRDLVRLSAAVLRRTTPACYVPTSTSASDVTDATAALHCAMDLLLPAEDVTVAANHLCLAYARCAQFDRVAAAYQEATRGPCERSFVNVQQARALAAAGHSKEALMVLEQLLEVTSEGDSPEMVPGLLLAAKLSLGGSRQKARQAVVFAERAVEQARGILLTKAHYMHGVALQRLACGPNKLPVATQLHRQALDALCKAYDRHARDAELLFHLALEYAFLREIESAMQLAEAAIALNPTNAALWMLLTLCKTATKDLEGAATVCETGLEQCGHVQLLALRAKIALAMGNGEGGIEFFKQALAASKTQQCGPVPASALGRLWLMICAAYVELEQYDDAAVALEQAAALEGDSCEVVFHRAVLLEAEEKHTEALTQLENALALEPTHAPTLLHTGILHHKQAKFTLAQSALESALQIDGSSHEAWYYLGLSLRAVGQTQDAADALATALDLEATVPVMPFTELFRDL